MNASPNMLSLEAGKKFMAVTGVMALAALFLVAMPETAHAGTGGSNSQGFEEVWEILKEWTQGSLGRVIAGSMILVGIIAGIARQSIMSFALGIGGGMGLTYAPNVIESIVSATVPYTYVVNAAATAIGNGLQAAGL